MYVSVYVYGRRRVTMVRGNGSLKRRKRKDENGGAGVNRTGVRQCCEKDVKGNGKRYFRKGRRGGGRMEE